MNNSKNKYLKNNNFLHAIKSIQLNCLPPNEIIHICDSIDLSRVSTSDLHTAYLSWAKKNELIINSGVIATPTYLAEYMVNETILTLGKSSAEIAWYDPCCGSGTFVEAILKSHLNKSKKVSEIKLPFITVAEIFPVGIFFTVLVIKKVLQQNGLDICKYIASNRIKFILNDSLSLYKEQSSQLENNGNRLKSKAL